MLRYVICFSVIMLMLVNCELTGQTIYTYGNLLKIRFDQKEVSSADTLGAWYDIHKPGPYEYYVYQKYFSHFSIGENGYFLTKYYNWVDRPWLPSLDGAKQVINEGSSTSRRCGDIPYLGWDIMEPFMIDRTRVFEAKNGCWLVSGIFNNAFLDKKDSLFIYGNRPRTDTSFGAGLVSIVGKVKNKYLGVFRKNNQPNEYYLINPDTSPYIDSSGSAKVTFTNLDFGQFSNAVIEIRNVTDSLYAVQSYPGGLYLFRLSGNTFKFVKNVPEVQPGRNVDWYYPWEIRNSKFYYINGSRLECYDYSSADTAFTKKRVLLDSLFFTKDFQGESFGADKQFKHFARLFSSPGNSQDTMKIYDVDKEKFINSISLGNIKNSFSPVVDSPYVYLHQITRQYTETGVEELQDGTPKSFSLTAFPNPFNPATTISYSIPKESYVELKVFDVLGREVAYLLNEKKTPGNYKIQFDRSSLPSGVYICILKAGSFRESRKLLLLK